MQRYWGVGIGIAVGLLIGVPIGWGATLYPTDTSFTLALLTAIGTIGSAVGAVGIAAWQFKMRKDELYVDAIQVAAASHLKLDAIADGLERGLGKICEALENAEVSGNDLVATLMAYATVSLMPVPDARRLIPISSHMSAKLATVEAELDLLTKFITALQTIYLAGHWNDFDKRKRDAEFIRTQMHRLVKMLTEVASGCLEAVSAFEKRKPRG
ncbi:hypothetical protein [Alcaligenes nematophilus]|uniref:hypothetical protein n=1 Tax=Alcaligenes nematophilus TaxID=2994643 RepID=UPI0038502D03